MPQKPKSDNTDAPDPTSHPHGIFGAALVMISLAQAIIVADLAPGTVSADCQKDIDALGTVSAAVSGAQAINNATLAAAVVGTDYENLLTATAPASTLNDPSIPAKYLSAPISSVFGGATKAVSQLGGSTVYVDPNYVIRQSALYDAGLLTHEALHNLGLNDPQAKSALGLTSAQCGSGTDCITAKLQSDCFPPPQPTVLGGPGAP